MTVYCPNCGKPNTNEAQSCASCSTELKPQKSAAPKFKGTMMMTGMAAPPAPAAPAAPPPTAPGGPVQGGPVQAGAPHAKKDMAFQATMLGPMTPPPGAPASPIAPPAGGGFGAPPAAGFGAPPAAGFGAPADPTPAPGGFGVPAAGGFGGGTPAPGTPAPGTPAPGTPAPSGFGASADQGFGTAPTGQPPAAGGFGGGTPAPGGFGAPAAGGFGAPADQGFGTAPTGQPPAAGGFGGGTPTPGTPAPGGFGAPAAGGFGAPAGGQPAQGGGFAPAGGAPPAGSAPGGAPPSGGSKKKILIGVGVGCLFIIMVSCALGSWLCYRAKNAVQSGGQDIAAELNRFTLTLTLTGIRASCGVDPSGSGTFQSFHAQVFPQLQGTACQVTDDTIAAFGDNHRSEAHGASGSDDEALATSLGADINQCYRYTSGTAKVTACLFPEGFKIISLENPGAVQ